MPAFIALPRAVNVGGTGKLPTSELIDMAKAAGFARPRTCIASGNLVFDSALTEAQVKARLEASVARYAGKPVSVMVRTAEEMAAVLAANPFPGGRRTAPSSSSSTGRLRRTGAQVCWRLMGKKQLPERANSISTTARAWRSRSSSCPQPPAARRATSTP